MNTTPKTLMGIALMATLLIVSSCKDDDDNTTTTPNVNVNTNKTKTTGFVVVGQTPSQTAVVKYIEELPADGNNIDLSKDVTDFPRFFPNSLFDHALFLPNPDESVGGFTKYVVNETGDIVEEALLSVSDPSSFRIGVRDAEVGIFHDRATPNSVTVFNPTTMQITNTIDMSAGFVPGGIDQRYNSMYFRDNDVFMPIRGNDDSVFPSMVVHQANLASNSFVGNTQRDGNGVSSIQTVNQFGQNIIDAQGNLYIMDGGNFDGAGIPAAINKIPAGSNKFDTSYNFFPAQVLNPANVFLPTANTLYVTEGTKAILKVNSETPQAAIDIVLAAGGVQNLTPNQRQQVLSILFSAESAKWCEIDLAFKTVTPIAGIPQFGIFAATSVFRHNGDWYLAVVNSAEQAFYRYNPSTGAAERAFAITGADLTGIYNLAENN